MGLFRNKTDKVLDFKLASQTYTVEAGGLVEVPDVFDYAIASYGLPLVNEQAKVSDSVVPGVSGLMAVSERSPGVDPIERPAKSGSRSFNRSGSR